MKECNDYKVNVIDEVYKALAFVTELLGLLPKKTPEHIILPGAAANGVAAIGYQSAHRRFRKRDQG